MVAGWENPLAVLSKQVSVEAEAPPLVARAVRAVSQARVLRQDDLTYAEQ